MPLAGIDLADRCCRHAAVAGTNAPSCVVIAESPGVIFKTEWSTSAEHRL